MTPQLFPAPLAVRNRGIAVRQTCPRIRVPVVDHSQETRRLTVGLDARQLTAHVRPRQAEVLISVALPTETPAVPKDFVVRPLDTAVGGYLPSLKWDKTHP